eukprot:CAMPEP_0196581432 /NCGR_PEP_ID=MMETSP1081-20130531/33956_1 /TAXON_ID=36882 /ORGANISM="Pyramimonas amylifera, Strain CCMP720" /LENGTH=109 /DNA_ID=CAMNT_0041901659 /DNA_START=211 /DNA_END=540 /DNA_ORIENTATION=-
MSDLQQAFHKRKKIDLLEGCDIEPWNPRPGFVITTQKRCYELDVDNSELRDGWVSDMLAALAGAMSQSSRPQVKLYKGKSGKGKGERVKRVSEELKNDWRREKSDEHIE